VKVQVTIPGCGPQGPAGRSAYDPALIYAPAIRSTVFTVRVIECALPQQTLDFTAAALRRTRPGGPDESARQDDRPLASKGCAARITAAYVRREWLRRKRWIIGFPTFQ
jgi:hypothetical protein